MSSRATVSLHAGDWLSHEMAVAYRDRLDSVVVDSGARRTKQNDAAVGRVRHDIVANDSGTAANADTIGPFHKCVRATRADVVVPNRDVVAEEVRTFREMQTGPTARIIRVHGFDQLARIRATHLDICPASSRCAGTVPVDLNADKETHRSRRNAKVSLGRYAT
jgi:hypothetical protein